VQQGVPLLPASRVGGVNVCVSVCVCMLGCMRYMYVFGGVCVFLCVCMCACMVGGWVVGLNSCVCTCAAYDMTRIWRGTSDQNYERLHISATSSVQKHSNPGHIT